MSFKQAELKQAELKRGIDSYLADGGKIKYCKPRHMNPSGDVVLNLPAYRPQKSGYPPKRESKGNSILTKLSISGMNPLITPGTKMDEDKITSMIIAGSLSFGRLPEAAKWLALYKYTGDKKSYSQLKTWLLCAMATTAIDEKWNLRKKQGQLEPFCITAIDNCLHPHNYINLTYREWSRRVQLSCHTKWKSVWAVRYFKLYGDLVEYDYMLENHVKHQF